MNVNASWNSSVYYTGELTSDICVTIYVHIGKKYQLQIIWQIVMKVMLGNISEQNLFVRSLIEYIDLEHYTLPLNKWPFS